MKLLRANAPRVWACLELELKNFKKARFTADNSGELEINYLLDCGWYKGELAIFSLRGLEELNIRSHADFVKEAASRALSRA